MTTTQNPATTAIDQYLREEHPYYCFGDLVEDFADALAEIIEHNYEGDYVCVGIPSSTEVSFPIALVRQALKENGR